MDFREAERAASSSSSEHDEHTDPEERMNTIYDAVAHFYDIDGIEGREKNRLMEEQMRLFILDMLETAPSQLYAAFIALFRRFYEFEVVPGDPKGAPGVIAILWFNTFDKEIFEECGELDRMNVLAGRKADADQVLGALRIMSSYRTQKYLMSIERVFQLREPDMESVLVQHVKGMFDRRHFAKSMNWILHYDLREHFHLEEVICYAYLTNEPPLLDKFIGENEMWRERSVRYLDYFIEIVIHEPRPDIRKRKQKLAPYEKDFLDEYAKMGAWRRDAKRLEKATMGRAKAYGYPESYTPHLVNLRCINGIIHHHYDYVNNRSDQRQYDDIVRQALINNGVLREFYLGFCCNQRQYGMALRCAYMLDISREEWPDALSTWAHAQMDKAVDIKEGVEQLLQRRRQRLEQEDQNSELFENFPIHMIESWAQLVELMDYLKALPEAKTIGIDTEWAPAFLTTTERLALIQISNGKKAFLVDIVALEPILTQDQWLQFFDALFCTSFMKVGYDLRHDFRAIIATFPFAKDMLTERMQNVIDLYRLLQNIQLMRAFVDAIFGSAGVPASQSLAAFASTICGVTIDKSEQVGNWANRPLRREQKKYAALDAYIVVSVYYEICKRMLAAGLLDSQADDCTRLEQSSRIDMEVLDKPKTATNLSPMKRGEEEDIFEVVQKAQEEGPSQTSSYQPRGVTEIKFIVDSMANGLGQKLRQCGFDTILVGNRQLIINTCRVDPSYVAISCGKGAKQIAESVDQAQVLSVPTSHQVTMDDLLVYTIRELNLVVRQSDIFSRCHKCNSACFVCVPAPALKVLYVMKLARREIEPITSDMIPPAVEDLRRARSEEYAGHRCEAVVSATGIIVKCDNGELDVTAGLLHSDERDAPVPVAFEYNLHVVYDRPGLLFQVCADCGKTQGVVFRYHGDFIVRRELGRLL